MEQSQITESNRNDYFKTVYTVQTFAREELLDIAPFKDKKIVAIDSCGFYYQQLFFNIFKIEHVQTASAYKLDRDSFNRLFNNINNISEKGDVLLLDHCPLLFKYKSELELKTVLTTLTDIIKPTHCLIRMSCATLGDNRLTDRFKNLCSIIPNNYVVEHLHYTPLILSFKLLKKHELGIH